MAVLAVLAVLYTLDAKRKVQKNENAVKEPEPKEQQQPDLQGHGTECCGKHAVCEKQKLAQARLREAQYFDDEELDRYRGRQSDSYDDAEVEEFRYVMYTMRSDEVRTWIECIEARGIELPDQLKDEAWAMLSE